VQKNPIFEYTLKPNNELEGFDLIKKNSIQTPDDAEPIGEIVATIYDIESFQQYLMRNILWQGEIMTDRTE
jgi:hypothetical protein